MNEKEKKKAKEGAVEEFYNDPSETYLSAELLEKMVKEEEKKKKKSNPRL